MKEFLWKVLAQVAVQPVVTALLLRQAKKTPYLHILSPVGDSVYMERYWLLNPYDRKTNKPRWSWLPFSVRIHHIHRPDYDAHCHDHPWDARTIILRGWYREKRLATGEHRDRILDACLEPHEKLTADRSKIEASEVLARLPGDTAPLKFGEYHKIDKVSPGGAITLFITWKYRGKWGFWVDGAKVYWKTYLGIPDDGDLPNAAPAKTAHQSILDRIGSEINIHGGRDFE